LERKETVGSPCRQPCAAAFRPCTIKAKRNRLEAVASTGFRAIPFQCKRTLLYRTISPLRVTFRFLTEAGWRTVWRMPRAPPN
jgi:hypothetical protein